MNESNIIKNGFVIDPEKSTIEKKEIGMINGKLVDPQEVREKAKNIQYINAEGCYVSPGFIDMHVHVFKDYTELGIDADLVGVEQGVTTIVDAGSAGYDDYQLFKDNVIDKSKTEILSFINVSRKGLCVGLAELANLGDLMTLEEASEIVDNEPSIVGIKARMSGSVVKDSGIKPLEHARILANKINKPIMVHIGNPPPNLTEIFPLLNKGDIVTHAFHGKKHGILDENNEMILEVRNALKRGVLFDVGHGTSSFSYNTIRRFKEKYDYSFTISTDIYLKNYDDPVGSLMKTMTKLLELGFSLEEVVQAVTINAAKALKSNEIGTLNLGTRADITIFKISDQYTKLIDSEGETLVGKRNLDPYMTFRNGKVVYSK